MLDATLKGMLAHKLRLLPDRDLHRLGSRVPRRHADAERQHAARLRRRVRRRQRRHATSPSARRRGRCRAQDSDERAHPCPRRLLESVEPSTGSRRPRGTSSGYALLTGSDGKPIQPTGAPTLGSNLAADPDLRGERHAADRSRTGTAPARSRSTPRRPRRATWPSVDRTNVLFRGPPGTFTVVGIVGFGDEDDLGGSTSAYFDLATAQRVLGKQRRLRHDRRQGATRVVSDSTLAERVDAALPVGHRGPDRRGRGGRAVRVR